MAYSETKVIIGGLAHVPILIFIFNLIKGKFLISEQEVIAVKAEEPKITEVNEDDVKAEEPKINEVNEEVNKKVKKKKKKKKKD